MKILLRLIIKKYIKVRIMVYRCSNVIYPDPESDNHLLTILLKICESELVERIGTFNFWLNDIELTTSNIYGINDEPRILETGEYSIGFGGESFQNKISGLLIENEKVARDRIKKVPWISYYIKPGLNGIHQIIHYIKFLLTNQNYDLPEYLKNINLRNYRFFMGVIWKMNAHLFKSNDNSYEIMEYEWNTICGGLDPLGYRFSFSNSAEEGCKIYTEKRYLNHLNKVTEILDKIAPNKYIAGPDEMEDFLKLGILKLRGRKFIPVEYNSNFLKSFHDYEWKLAPRKNIEEKN